MSAVLQWTSDGRRQRLRLGEVDLPTRSANLREAWKLAGNTGLLVAEDTAGSWASSPATRASMRSNRSRDTKPELRLRSLLHGAGLRYRVSAKPLPHLRRTADVVFTKARVAVFVDGCFWHGCLEHGSIPATNRDFWSRKIEGNTRRDRETDRLLAEAGWGVVRVWEHTPPAEALALVRQVLAQVAGRDPGQLLKEQTAVE
ncbi:very short patch repair endonuclease [Streptomyces sp. NPDC058611]|uniref:very short patch repair endonuclease n=1 Tax=unclassified Streptomyces TaxID=2593676 RepID=UPI003659197A